MDSGGSAKVVSVLHSWVIERLKETTFTGEPIRLSKVTPTTGMLAVKTRLDLFMNENDPYFWFPDYVGDNHWNQLWKEWGEPQNRIRISNTIFGKKKKKKISNPEVNILSTLYDTYHKFAPLQNVITGRKMAYVFLDSRVIAFDTYPQPIQGVLDSDPVVIFHEHTQKRETVGRRLLASDTLIQNQPIIRRYCVRWDEDLRLFNKWQGGWTTEGCWTVNSTWDMTVCKCQKLGTFSLLAVLEKPFIFPFLGKWLHALKWFLYIISAVSLIAYIAVIFVRVPLHEQFHGIRVNSAVAAFSALTCFVVAEFVQPHDGLYHEPCAVLSGFTQYFYLALGSWLYMEAHALFSAIVAGIIGGRLFCYMLTAWGLPAIFVGAYLGFNPSYGEDYRCLAGKNNSTKLALCIPIILFGICAIVQAMMTSCNLGTPSIKRDIIVKELSHQNRALTAISWLFLFLWLLAIFAYVDMGFDASTSFEPLFVIFNSSFGIFMVCFWSFGSAHFKASLLNRNSPEKNKFYSLTWRLPSVELLRNLDPPDDSSYESSSTGRSKNSSSRMT